MPSAGPAVDGPRMSTLSRTAVAHHWRSSSRQARQVRPARRRVRSDVVLADKAYSSQAIRLHLRQRGIRAVIPQPADQAANRKRRGRLGGRPPAFDREPYKRRNPVERCTNKIEQWRGLATHYNKTVTIYLAGLHLAAIFT
ncbi:transposase [Streptomyces longwoodensis]|uniref:transposase n=1 Tax=Streptomyces longwoodensis TaxID=68231 RepID=UPI0037F88BAB